MFGLIVAGWMLIFLDTSRTQDIIFPSETTSTISEQGTVLGQKANGTRCPLNMTLYQDEEKKDNQFCDCNSGLIYYPPNDSCYLPYRKGPCSSRKYLLLGQGETVARCKKNPCLTDGLVPFNGACHELGKSGSACNSNKTLGVDEDTQSVKCIQIEFPTRQIIMAPLKACRPGTRRLANGTCRMIL